MAEFTADELEKRAAQAEPDDGVFTAGLPGAKAAIENLLIARQVKGSGGSGNWAHESEGRIGLVGGSDPGGGLGAISGWGLEPWERRRESARVRKRRAASTDKPKATTDPPELANLEAITHTDPRNDPASAHVLLEGWKNPSDRYEIAYGAIYDYQKGGADDLVVVREYGEDVVGIASMGTHRWQNPYKEMRGQYREVSRVATAWRGYGNETMHLIAHEAAKDGSGIFLRAIPAAVGFYEAIGMRRAVQAERVFFWTPEDVAERAKGQIEDLEPENGVFVAEAARRVQEGQSALDAEGAAGAKGDTVDQSDA